MLIAPSLDALQPRVDIGQSESAQLDRLTKVPLEFVFVRTKPNVVLTQQLFDEPIALGKAIPRRAA